MNWIAELGKFIQQTTKVWLGLAIASGFLLLFPQLTLIGDAPDVGNSYLSVSVRVLFVLSCAMLLSDFVFYVRDHIRDRRKKDAKFEVLKRLTPPERELFRRYVEAETKSIGLDVRDPTVLLFRERGWISQPMHFMGVTIGDTREPILPPHVLEDWLYYYLKDHPELIR